MLIALARFGSGAYNVFKALHILAAVTGFGGLLAVSFVGVRVRRYSGAAGDAVRDAQTFLLTRAAEPGLWLTFLLGFAVVGTSDKSVEMSETWVGVSMALALIAIAVIRFVIVPAVRDGGEAAAKRAAAATGVTHLLLVVVLIMMVFKPGG